MTGLQSWLGRLSFSFSANPSQKSSTVHIVTALRGLAALAVCWYHVVNDVYPLLKGSSIAYLGSFGWLGVEAFFVISGFVIPYALTTSDYSVRRFPHFLLRRIVRIDPPYLLSIGLTMLIAAAAVITPGYHGAPPHYTVTQLLAHLGYITNFAGGQINRAYWTLGIEFQYYLLIGLACCFVIRCGRSCYYVILAGGIILDHCFSLTPVEPKYVIGHWMPLFLLGVLAASHRLNLMPPRHIGERLLVTTAVSYWSLGPLIASVGLSTCLLILTVDYRGRILEFFGNISYSLYLIHSPVGERLYHLMNRIVDSRLQAIAAFWLVMAATIFCAWVFNVLVEEPSRRLARRIRYDLSPRLFFRAAAGQETANC